MEDGSLHHIEIGVDDGNSLCTLLNDKFGFYLIAKRSCIYCSQWVMKAGKAVILVTQKGKGHLDRRRDAIINADPLYNSWWGQKNDQFDDDSVFNVALKVTNLQKVLNQVNEGGGEILHTAQKFEDGYGSVEIAVVKSCVGNVLHTLISYEEYTGPFLPGFIDVTSKDSVSTFVSHIDHITFVCNRRTTPEVLRWYESCFQMKRFFINSNEDQEEGFVIRDTGIGMRMKAMEYWRCAEAGITNNTDNKHDSIKFVLVESLQGQGQGHFHQFHVLYISQTNEEQVKIAHKHSQSISLLHLHLELCNTSSFTTCTVALTYDLQGPNQVDIFLEDHGGPGIQHIGLYTPDILSAVSTLQQNGTEFVETPPAYYTDEGKLSEMKQVGFNVEELRSKGILLDTEADSSEKAEDNNQPSHKYLLQKFTKPLFTKRTFFLELIQRAGAQGFGAGNITALWRAVQNYLTESESSSSSK